MKSPLFLLCGWLLCASAAAAPSKLRVFILAGQSNMEGQAVVDLNGPLYNHGRGTLLEVMAQPANARNFAGLRNQQGGWAVRSDVWVRYQREGRPLLAGSLGVGYTRYGDAHHFGPELQIGHVLGDAYEDQVLLIKTAWGGKSLHEDFRPPGAGGQTGPCYRRMVEEVRESLASLKRDFPAYDGAPVEMAGLVWYHGWNDGIQPKTAVPEYAANLSHLIRDLRRDLNAPRLPVVIGELTGPWADAPPDWNALRSAQASVAKRPEFIDNVIFVRTRDFVRKAEDSPNPGHGHHEFGNAETALLVGDALGKAALQMAGREREQRDVLGWSLSIDKRLLASNEAAVQIAMKCLEQQLSEIVRVVPASAVTELRKIPLWFSFPYPGVRPTAEYHPDLEWIKGAGREAALAKGVEFTSVEKFEAESKRMPNFVLHELAHGYHDRFLPGGFGNPAIKAAYERAKASGSYDAVQRWNGTAFAPKPEKAYAMNNPMEYFAESTEAYFSRNDFYPFNNKELREHDPRIVEVLEEAWGVR